MKYWIVGFLLFYHAIVFALSSSEMRGEQVFLAYCSGCHALKYADSMQLAETSLPKKDAQQWFGKLPPDLSLIVTVRGELWLYDYLNGFYPDNRQIFGENNHWLPSLKMPNPFSMESIEKKDALIQDLIIFLKYVAEPHRHERQKLGFWISLWICCLIIVLYCLYRILWKKINTK